MLLKHGADVNFSDNDGSTPLHQSCIYGNRSSFNLFTTLFSFNLKPVFFVVGYDKIAEKLLKYDAKVNITDKNGYTPLHWAAEGGMWIYLCSERELLKIYFKIFYLHGSRFWKGSQTSD